MPLTTEQIEALKKITSPSVANAIEVFKVRPRQEGNVSSEIRGLFPELGPLVGYAATCLVRAEKRDGVKYELAARLETSLNVG